MKKNKILLISSGFLVTSAVGIAVSCSKENPVVNSNDEIKQFISQIENKQKLNNQELLNMKETLVKDLGKIEKYLIDINSIKNKQIKESLLNDLLESRKIINALIGKIDSIKSEKSLISELENKYIALKANLEDQKSNISIKLNALNDFKKYVDKMNNPQVKPNADSKYQEMLEKYKKIDLEQGKRDIQNYTNDVAKIKNINKSATELTDLIKSQRDKYLGTTLINKEDKIFYSNEITKLIEKLALFNNLEAVFSEKYDNLLELINSDAKLNEKASEFEKLFAEIKENKQLLNAYLNWLNPKMSTLENKIKQLEINELNNIIDVIEQKMNNINKYNMSYMELFIIIGFNGEILGKAPRLNSEDKKTLLTRYTEIMNPYLGNLKNENSIAQKFDELVKLFKNENNALSLRTQYDAFAKALKNANLSNKFVDDMNLKLTSITTKMVEIETQMIEKNIEELTKISQDLNSHNVSATEFSITTAAEATKVEKLSLLTEEQLKPYLLKFTAIIESIKELNKEESTIAKSFDVLNEKVNTEDVDFETLIVDYTNIKNNLKSESILNKFEKDMNDKIAQIMNKIVEKYNKFVDKKIETWVSKVSNLNNENITPSELKTQIVEDNNNVISYDFLTEENKKETNNKYVLVLGSFKDKIELEKQLNTEVEASKNSVETKNNFEELSNEVKNLSLKIANSKLNEHTKKIIDTKMSKVRGLLSVKMLTSFKARIEFLANKFTNKESEYFEFLTEWRNFEKGYQSFKGSEDASRNELDETYNSTLLIAQNAERLHLSRTLIAIQNMINKSNDIAVEKIDGKSVPLSYTQIIGQYEEMIKIMKNEGPSANVKVSWLPLNEQNKFLKDVQNLLNPLKAAAEKEKKIDETIQKFLYNTSELPFPSKEQRIAALQEIIRETETWEAINPKSKLLENNAKSIKRYALEAIEKIQTA